MSSSDSFGQSPIRRKYGGRSHSKGLNLVRLRNAEDHVSVLPELDAQIVELRLSGKSPFDIAEELGLSPNNVYSRLSVAAKKMEQARDGTITESATEHERFMAMSHIDIGRVLGCSRTRVQQIEADALKKLRRSPYGRELLLLYKAKQERQ